MLNSCLSVAWVLSQVWPDLVAAVKQASQNARLLPGENDIFITKCVQFKELLDVRHSVFIMGNAGVAKSSTWKMLAAGFTILGDKTMTEIINPKVFTAHFDARQGVWR